MERVVIFGSQGLLGTALVAQFKQSFDVVGLDRKEIDILDAKQVTKKLGKLKPKLVINAVAYNNVDEAEKNDDAFEKARELNGYAVETLAKITKKLGIPLVHFSSEYVFDGANKKGYAEDSHPRPINRYGETKLLGERLLTQSTDQYYLVRLSRLFGTPGLSGLTKKSFIDSMLEQAQKSGQLDVSVVNEEKSCPTYSVDLARLVYEIVINRQPFGIYHGANSGACTWFELAKEAFASKGLAVKVVPIKGNAYPRPAKRPQFGELINTKLPPQRSWQDALRDYILH